MEIDFDKFREEWIELAKKVLVKNSFKKLNLFAGCVLMVNANGILHPLRISL